MDRRRQLFGANQVLGNQFYGLGSIALGAGYNMNVVPTGGFTTVQSGADSSVPVSVNSSGEFAAGLEAGGLL